MLNRGVVMVRPKQPYLDWGLGVDDSGIAPDTAGERTVYLIPSFESDDEAWELLSTAYDLIFEGELWGWHTEPADWPQHRTFEMFRAWFDVELHSVVEDLCDGPLIDDD